MKKILATAAAILCLAGCASVETRPEADPEVQLTRARGEFTDKDYDEAAATLRELLASRPPARIRVEADFLAGETAMAREEFAEARVFFSEFSGLYPGNPRVPEAEFQIAESWYQERNRKDRDVTPLREARARFVAFLAAHPEHPLSSMARERVASCTAALISYERGVADLYFGRGAFAGAAGRLEAIVTSYPGAPDEARTLFDLVTALGRAGDRAKAALYRERLLKAYPDTPWAGLAAAEAPGATP
jgi:outer membrane protein assembly factor BamD